MLITDLWRDILAKYPERLAFQDSTYSITYQELDQRANQLANHLIASGLKEKEAVGVLAYRDNNYIIAILAILKTNSFYVPLDPKYPDERLEYIIDNAEINYIIGETRYLSPILPKHNEQKIFIDSPQVIEQSDIAPKVDTIDDLSNIYILFTSGSTGKPKGVMVNHRGVINLVRHFQNTFNPPLGNYNSCQNARLSFDASTLEIWYNLLSGATIYFTPESVLLQPAKLRDWIIDKEIREILLVTPIAEMLFDQKFPADCSFKYLYLGGDTLKKLPPRDFKAQIVNVYGPTECACITVLDTFPLAYNGPITIGKAIRNTRTYILDENLHLVETGELGELCIAGDSLGNGYWKLPEETKHAFIKNHEINRLLQEELIYRSGDLVRELPDGRIDFRGRIDFQVKIRGLRIELDEIEKVLHRHPKLDQTTVLALGEGNEKFLVAYYTSKDKSKIEQDELVRYCQKELPDYMVPQFYLHLDELPLTDNNKVDRRKLESLELPKEDRALIAPENDLQSEILSIWQDILDYKKVSIDDNFFYIGGHSLKAAQIVNELNNRGYQLELSQFMSNPTIKALSELISPKPILFQSIEKVPRDKDYYRITKNQEDLWYLSHLDDSKRIYNIVVLSEILEGIDEDKLIKSLEIITDTYEGFKSYFKEVAKNIYQFIESDTSLNYKKVQITSQEDFDKLVKQVQEEELRADSYPLYKIYLINFNQKLFLLMNIHHLIFDGWSMQVFIDKLSSIYYNLLQKKDNSSEIIPALQNIDYAQWLFSRKENYDEELKYWHELLIPFTPDLRLTSDRASYKYLSPKGKRIWFKINNELLSNITLFAQKNSISLFSLLLTIYQLVLAEKSKRSDITVAFPYAGRKSKLEEELMGYYTNMVIVRANIYKKDFSQLITEIHQQVMQAISHSSLPFGDLVKSFNLPIDKSKTPLYQAIFVMQNWHGEEINNIIKSEKELGSNTSKTDIILNAEETDSGMEFWFEYNTDFYQESLIMDLQERYLTILSDLDFPSLKSNQKTAFILTESTLGLQCAEELLKNDYHIYGIISPNEQVRKWAQNKGIYTANLVKADLKAILEKYPYDYLFSIVNSILLDQEILATPIKFAINYHDSLLPKYAGLYASYWAIFNNETKHGISWHLVDRGIDTGDIILQKEIIIEQEEISNSLNLKCYEAAIESFRQVLSKLERDEDIFIKQDLSLRTYFGADYRPNELCSISQDTDLATCHRLYRASDFALNENPISTLKFKAANNFYHISSANFVSSEKSNPGELLIRNQKLELHLKDGIITINEVKDLEGNLLVVNDFTNIPKWDNPSAEDYQVYQKAVQNEAFWLKELQAYTPLEVVQNEAKKTVIKPLLKSDNAELAILVCFLARLSTQGNFSIMLDVENPHPLLQKRLVLNIKVDFNQTVKENITAITKQIKKVYRKQKLLQSIFYRYPQFHSYQEIFAKFELTYDEYLYNHFKKQLDLNTLLKNVILAPQTDLDKIKLWNSQSLELPEQNTFLNYFNKAVLAYPNNIAVECNSQTISYQELDISTSSLANYLLANHTDAEVVAISANRSIEMIIVILAILKSGKAYLPIDPSYPSDRIKHILDNSQCKVIFTDLDFPEIVKLKKLSVLLCRNYASNISQEITISQQDLAYIIYTSGTTGKPKGVMINHGNLINHNLIVQKRYDITPSDRVLQFASISFDISVEEIFPTLISGACLVLRSEEINKSASQFLQFIQENKISIVNLPTAFWHQIAKSLPLEKVSPLIKTLVIGGEKASSELYKHWLEHAPSSINLFNTYGPTEATIIATIDDGIDDTIGKAMPNTTINILDRFMQTMPLGYAGAIFIGGKGVSPGYYQNLDLTKERFIESSDYGRIYATGDLGLYYQNGKIKFLGRDDDQVKLNGYRIELSEIENVITTNSSLKTVFADLRGSDNNRKIYLYYLSNTEIEKDFFTTLVKQYLPEYMLPSEYIRISELPLNPNGKINKKLLPEPEIKDAFLNVQAYNLYELKLLPLFREVLGKQIDFEDNFFKEGGDSLKAIELIVSMEKSLGMKINSSSLYQHSSVRELSRFFQEEKQDDFSIITPLQRGDKAFNHLFLTHTTPGDVLGYVNLIQALDDRIPVYGIQSQGLSSEECHSDFSDMVQSYTDEILKIQNKGPFHIGGWCYGGVLAFEIGVELKKRGFKDIKLYLIETWGRPNTKFRKINYQLRRLFNAIILGPKFWHSYLHTKLSNFSNIHKVLEEDFIDNITETLGGKSQEEIDKLKRIYRLNIDALNKHTMSDLPGEINLFLAEEALEGLIPDPKYGWAGMVNKINYFSVKGSHTTVLKHPFVEDISEVISKMLIRKS